MAGDASEGSVLEADEAFFTEEAYENFTIQPKFDANLFIAYNPSIKGCTISPVKKRKLSQVPNTSQVPNNENNQEIEVLSVQPAKEVSSCNAPKQDVNQKTPKIVWNLKSPKAGFPYPRHSCMTHGQQQRYIELSQKHGHWRPNQTRYSMTPEDITDKQQLRKLQMLVQQEQQDFMKFAEHVARCSPKDYEHLPPAALQYAMNQWHLQEQYVKQLPQYFSVCQTIGIVPAAVFPTDPVLTFSTRLLQLGQPQVVEPSTLDGKLNHNLVPAFNRCSQHKQATGRGSSIGMDTGKDLSTDENAVRLAARYQANIVIAMAALPTLADNHAPDYDKSWRIPVQIRSSNMSDTDSTLKTVFISDPLTNPCFPHDVSRAFHQVALHDLVTEGSQVQKSPDNAVLTDQDFGTSSQDDNQYDDYLEHDLTSLETFGSPPMKSHHRKLKDAQMKNKTETKGSRPNHSQQWDINTASTGSAKPTEGNLVCLPKHDPDQSLPEVTNESITLSELTPEMKHSLAPLTEQLFTEGMEECFRRESDEEEVNAAKEQLTDQAKQSGSHVVTQGNQRETCQRSRCESRELGLASDSSEAEGELVIALSSGPDSPLKTSSNQSAVTKGITEMQDVGKHNTDSEEEDPSMTGLEDDQLDTSVKNTPRAKRQEVPQGVEPKEAPTPRRSRRLQRNQPSDISCNAALPHSSEKTLELPLPDMQVLESVAEDTVGGGKSKPAIALQEVMGEAILDSPLSPPPHEKGLAPPNPSTEKRTPTQEPESLQLKKQKMTSRSVVDSSSPESKQAPCLRYNLRSKSAGSGNQDHHMAVGAETLSKEQKASGRLCFDHYLPSTRKMSLTNEVCSSEFSTGQAVLDLPVSEGNQTVLRKPAKDTTKSSEQDSRNPKRSPALRRPTQPVKQSLATSGVESTIDSILKLQERLHSGKVVNQSPAQPPISAAVGTMNVQGDGYMEKASDYSTPSEGNADYSLWRFGRHSLVVRSNVDAITLNHADGYPNKTQVVTIVPKMEHQAHFGHEQISVSELTKLWMSLLLQPGSKVIQGRVNAMTSDLMKLEQFDMNSALWEQPSFQPSCCMKMMFQILDKLTTLPEGHYLLCHSAGDMHACILQTATSGKKRSLFDLHQSYSQGPMIQSCPPQLLPWLPLDTNMMLPEQIATGRIPATFPPKNTGTNARGGVTKGASKKNKKKKKKAGKK
ncbi:little elongation complex subunit 2-like [Patiria miniata]|uniref:Little elongation complex subunit 2 C-terminal domain-containing protein n=1 Tax=Patiria miniata TaxID=46514 RepID=A0A913YZ94_PATMI|nr:little elongation complex subunit 2-like [Patiria miniata]